MGRNKSIFGAALLALIPAWASMGAECTHTIEPFQKEICNDNIDNNNDGKMDCRDRSCQAECTVSFTVDPVDTVSTDNQVVLSGKAVNIGSVLAEANGRDYGGIVSDSTWTATVPLISGRNQITLTAFGFHGQTLVRNVFTRWEEGIPSSAALAPEK